jgi:hypothetical protein
MSVPNEEFCPVPLTFLAELMRVDQAQATILIREVDHPHRSQLALFCYRRAHLRSLALLIASQCSRKELIDTGLMAGDALYIASRDGAPSASTRPKISLAGSKAA